MTEFEAATLSAQNALIWVGVVQASVALVVGLGEIGVIAWAVRTMVRDGGNREQRHADRHAEAMAKHAETMARHAENMEADKRQHAEFMAGHAENMKAGERQHAEAMAALRALIERTERNAPN